MAHADSGRRIVSYRARVISVPVDAETFEETKEEAAGLCRDIKRFYRNRADSILDGEGALVGLLGEKIAARYLFMTRVNGEGTPPSYHFDLKDSSDRTYEVKTKRRNYPCRPHYFCSVPDANATQRTSFYLFASLLWPQSEPRPRLFTILGYTSPQRFKQQCYFSRRGDVDPTSPPNHTFRFRADCWNIPAFALLPFPGGADVFSSERDIQPFGRQIMAMFTGQGR